MSVTAAVDALFTSLSPTLRRNRPPDGTIRPLLYALSRRLLVLLITASNYSCDAQAMTLPCQNLCLSFWSCLLAELKVLRSKATLATGVAVVQVRQPNCGALGGAGGRTTHHDQVCWLPFGDKRLQQLLRTTSCNFQVVLSRWHCLGDLSLSPVRVRVRKERLLPYQRPGRLHTRIRSQRGDGDALHVGTMRQQLERCSRARMPFFQISCQSATSNSRRVPRQSA